MTITKGSQKNENSQNLFWVLSISQNRIKPVSTISVPSPSEGFQQIRIDHTPDHGIIVIKGIKCKCVRLEGIIVSFNFMVVESFWWILNWTDPWFFSIVCETFYCIVNLKYFLCWKRYTHCWLLNMNMNWDEANQLLLKISNYELFETRLKKTIGYFMFNFSHNIENGKQMKEWFKSIRNAKSVFKSLQFLLIISMSGFVFLFLCVRRFLTQGVESTNLVQHQSNDNRLYVRKRGRKNACHSKKLKRKYEY